MTSNAKKISYNIFFGIGSQLLIALVGIIVPKLFISNFGSEVNGFLSSINQVLTYIVLLEAGVGAATLQALFKPVAEDDRDAINGILSATNQFYTRTGLWYLGCIVLLAIIFPLAVKSSIPVWQQVAIILISGGTGSIGYFLHAKFRILLNADGKLYIYTNAHTIVQLATSFSKVILILLGFNIVFVQLAHMILMFGLSLYIIWYTRRKYPWINLRVKPDKASISQKNSVLVHEVSQMIFNHTDVLLLTLFTNLKVVSVYTLYIMIVDIISTLIGNIHNGFSFRLGQIYNTDKKAFVRIFDSYEACYMALSMVLYCVTYLFLLPFMRLYTAGVTDIDYLDRYLPILFVTIKFLVSSRALSGATISYAGHFQKTQWRSVLESILNLGVSIGAILLLRSIKVYYGIYGALFGTVAALLYRANDMIIYTRRNILHNSPLKSYTKWVVNLIGFGIMLFISKWIPIKADGYFSLLVYAAGYTLMAFAVFGALNFLAFRKNMIEAIQFICTSLFSKLKKQKKQNELFK